MTAEGNAYGLWTLVTLAMFPILVYMFARLAWREECEALSGFGKAYRDYMDRVPAFIPRLWGTAASHAAGSGAPGPGGP